MRTASAGSMIAAALWAIAAGMLAGPVFAMEQEDRQAQTLPKPEPKLRPYTAPDETPPASGTDQGESIVSVMLGRHVLTQGMLAYNTPDGVLLPLGEFSRLLDFPIEVNAGQGAARGWFIREDRLFELSVANGTANVEGTQWTFNPAEIRVDGLEIYVSADRLSEWFPLDISLAGADSTLHISARESLPFEQALQRDSRLERGRYRNTEPEALPIVKPAYALASLPYADVVISAQAYEEEREDQTRGSLLLAGDLLYMNARAFVNVQNEVGVNDARLTLERIDMEGNALGDSLDVTEFSLGDLYTQRMPLIADSASALGLGISNQPLNRRGDLEVITLTGDAAPGWDVELYRNGQLLDFERVSADGRYEFRDVPLLLGANELRVVLLGPQGQQREQVQRYYAGPGLTGTGQAYYRFFAGQHEEQLLPDDQVFTDAGEGEPRVLGEFEYGLRRGLSIAAAYAHLPVRNEQKDLITLGLRGQYAGVFGRVDIASDTEAGEAYEFAALTRLGNLNLSASHALFREFESDVTLNEGGDLRSLSTVRTDFPLGWSGRRWGSASLTGEYVRFESGRSRLELRNRLSFRLWRVAVAHELEHRSNQSIDGDDSQTTGDLILGGRLGQRHRVRLSAGYSIDPESELQNITASSNTQLRENWDLRLDAFRSFADFEESQVMLGLSHHSRYAIWGAGVGYSNRFGRLFSANLSFSFGQNPTTGGLMLRPQGLARSGLVHARTFLDKNGDGLRSEGETGIAEVQFLGGAQGFATSENGEVALPAFGSHRPSVLKLDESSLLDPFWVSQSPGYNVVTRPGRVTEVDFPVLPTGEVDGTVYLIRDGEPSSASNILLVLTSGNGKRRFTTRSSFDGFFLFTRIPPGDYQLSIDPVQLEGSNLIASAPRQVSIRDAGDIDMDNTMTLTRKPAAIEISTDRPIQTSGNPPPEQHIRKVEL